MKIEILKCDQCGKEIKHGTVGSIHLYSSQITKPLNHIDELSFSGTDFCNADCFAAAVKNDANWEIK